ncbi:ferredoxin--NADP+ reductase [Nocardioides scoriae]|uniref:ferredoxin--NADP(+) reductase n=1 Tax=Nocardioides scoriae TaxID=642780 RepID=A0A1H1P7S1_9ACTN|nr:4Fe-4S binding protein [Nocardioides scoriae]SDS06689.1 ferredoxin--NADP+ reductase [Nocardioides scoriae]
MPYAITQSCCSDASCVSVCPVNCIHPTPDEPGFGTTEMLYVDPRACIDCGACADACPVDAIFPAEELLRGPDAAYVELNRDHFADAPVPEGDDRGWSDPTFPVALSPHAADLRVAVVGTGPSASYTAAGLLTTSAHVTMLDRLPVAGGLIRFGVAPDHTSTRAIADRFATVFRNPRLEMCLGVEVGRDVTHEELLAHHDAVVYAVGASADRTLGVPGEDLPGSLAARDLVGWYNGHPEVPTDLVDLELGAPARVVVVGNGNVALDVARLLLTDPEELVRTPLARHALAALRRSSVREVVLVGRRGPGDAAYALAELRPLLQRADLDVVVDGGAAATEAIAAAAAGSKAAALRDLPQVPLDAASPVGGRRRLVLRFDSVLERVDGDDRVGSVHLAPARPEDPGAPEPVVLHAGLVLRSVGYRSEPLPGLPFDRETSTVPHDQGRVVDPATGGAVGASYVVGWVKRGPRGGIGSNRADATETVASLVADANAGRLTTGRGSTRSFRRLLRSRT